MGILGGWMRGWMGLRSGAHLPPHQDALGLGLRGVEAGPDTWASLEVAHAGIHAGDVTASPHLGVGTSVGSVQEGPRGKGPCGARVPGEGVGVQDSLRPPGGAGGGGGGPRRPQGVQGVPWDIAVPPPPPSSDPRTLPSVISPPPALLLSQSPSAVLTAGRGGGVGWDIATSGHDRDSRSRS